MERKSYAGASVLVTGAGGFLGAAVCRALQSAGARVQALVRPDRSYPRLPAGVELHAADIADRESVSRAVRAARPQIVFHLAASLDRQRGMKALDQLVSANIMGTLNLLKAAAACGVEIFVYTGTWEEYGSGHPPFHEAQPLDPLTPYAASKATASMWCRTVQQSLGLNCINARLFMVYGPDQPEHFFIAQLFASLRSGVPLKMTAGEQTRDFTWLDDNVEALLKLGSRSDLGGQVFNLCSGHETSMRAVVATLSEVLGREVPVELGAIPYRESELFRSWGSPNKLLGATGVRLRTSVREGLTRLAQAEGLI